MQIVLDSSVVLKWYVPEEDSHLAVELRQWIHRNIQRVIVPRFFYLEMASILWKKQALRKELTPRDAHDIRHTISSLDFYVIEDKVLLSQACALAEKYTITPYDALYAASSIEESSVFVTADTKLVQNLQKHPSSEQFIPLKDWKRLQK